ncbi:hypothetical protein HDV03_003131 [Kappamyces sp. JEL0829]|nr:hypothetical protein HDV03_003131 [Kappamyces sp. JEL0829]
MKVFTVLSDFWTNELIEKVQTLWIVLVTVLFGGYFCRLAYLGVFAPDWIVVWMQYGFAIILMGTSLWDTYQTITLLRLLWIYFKEKAAIDLDYNANVHIRGLKRFLGVAILMSVMDWVAILTYASSAWLLYRRDYLASDMLATLELNFHILLFPYYFFELRSITLTKTDKPDTSVPNIILLPVIFSRKDRHEIPVGDRTTVLT